MRVLPFSGPIRHATLPVLVRDLWMQRASGILELVDDGTSKQIVFKDGDIVFAGTNVEEERLGEHLIKIGKIKRSVLDLACRVIELSHERMGKTIVELGWISQEDMEERVAEHLKDIIYSVFTWESGEYRFEPSEEPVAADLALHLPTADVIWEGVQRVTSRSSLMQRVGPPSSILTLKEGERLRIPIGRDEGFILALVDGTRSVRQVALDCPLSEEESLQRVYALILAGVIELVPAGDVVEKPREQPAPEESSAIDASQERSVATEQSVEICTDAPTVRGSSEDPLRSSTLAVQESNSVTEAQPNLESTSDAISAGKGGQAVASELPIESEPRSELSSPASSDSEPPVLAPANRVAPESPKEDSTETPESEKSEYEDSSGLEQDERTYRDNVMARRAAMMFGNFYDRLGVRPGATVQAIETGYREASRSLMAAPHYADKLDDIKKYIDRVKQRVEEAYQELSDPTRRRMYDVSIGERPFTGTVASGTAQDRVTGIEVSTLASEGSGAGSDKTAVMSASFASGSKG